MKILLNNDIEGDYYLKNIKYEKREISTMSLCFLRNSEFKLPVEILDMIDEFIWRCHIKGKRKKL